MWLRFMYRQLVVQNRRKWTVTDKSVAEYEG